MANNERFLIFIPQPKPEFVGKEIILHEYLDNKSARNDMAIISDWHHGKQAGCSAVRHFRSGMEYITDYEIPSLSNGSKKSMKQAKKCRKKVYRNIHFPQQLFTTKMWLSFIVGSLFLGIYLGQYIDLDTLKTITELIL